MSGAPRVLVLGTVLGQPMGGVRRHNAELLPRLARLLDERSGALAVLEGRDRIAFDLPNSVERIESNVPAQPPLLRAVLETRALRRALESARARGTPYDLVHSAHFPAPRDLGVPMTITVHDLRRLEEPHVAVARRLVASRLISTALRRTRRVLAVSETVACAIRERFDIEANRVVVIGNGSDHFTPLERVGPRDRAPLVCIGHIEPRKNLEIVLRALAADPSLPELELHGAGKGGEENRLRVLATELGLSARVRFVGPFDERDLPALYARAACVVLPSRIEGFGIVALEAQRARVPLAIARAGALPEVAGPTCPSFAPDDAHECARSVHAAMAQSSGALEAAARRAETFTWDRSARTWFDAIEDCH